MQETSENIIEKVRNCAEETLNLSERVGMLIVERDKNSINSELEKWSSVCEVDKSTKDLINTNIETGFKSIEKANFRDAKDSFRIAETIVNRTGLFQIATHFL